MKHIIKVGDKLLEELTQEERKQLEKQIIEAFKKGGLNLE